MPNADLDAVFDSAQADEHQDKVQALQGSLYSARQQDPEQAVKAQAAGVSPEILKAAPDLSKPQGPTPDQIVKETPKVANYLSDPQKAATSHDDIQSLQQIEKTIQDWKKTREDTGAMIEMASGPKAALQSMTGALGQGVSGLAKQLGQVPNAALTVNEALGIGEPYRFQPALMAAQVAAALGGAYGAIRSGNFGDIIARAQKAAAYVGNTQPPDPKEWDANLRKDMADNPALRFAAATKLATENPQFLHDQAADIAKTWKDDKLGGAALATRKTADMIASFVPYIAGEILSGGQATIPFALGAGAEGAEEARAKGLSPEMSIANAAGKAGTFMVSGKLATILPVQYFQKALGQEIGDKVSKEVVGSALTAGLKKTLGQFFHGTVAGGGLVGGNALTDYMTGADPHALDDIGPKMLETGLMMGATGPILGGMETAREIFHGQAPEIQEAATNKQHMLALAETTKASPAAQRDPAAWQTFLQEQTQGTHAENLHISPKDFDEVFSKHGIEPSAAATDLKADKSYADAKEFGHDIQIKSADLLSKMSDHPALEDFLNKSSSEPGGMTMEGADKAVQGERQKVREKQNAFDESLDKVTSDRKQNLIEAGLPETQAEKEAQLFSAFVKKQTTELQRNPGHENAMPEDFVKQMSLEDRTPQEMNLLQKSKQILGMDTGIKPEAVDENGLSKAEQAKVEAMPKPKTFTQEPNVVDKNIKQAKLELGDQTSNRIGILKENIEKAKERISNSTDENKSAWEKVFIHEQEAAIEELEKRYAINKLQEAEQRRLDAEAFYHITHSKMDLKSGGYIFTGTAEGLAEAIRKAEEGGSHGIPQTIDKAGSEGSGDGGGRTSLEGPGVGSEVRGEGGGNGEGGSAEPAGRSEPESAVGEGRALGEIAKDSLPETYHQKKSDSNPNAQIDITHAIAGDKSSEFKATIQRFQDANLSSGIHELGHYMLESMRRLSAMPNASDQLKSDLAKLEEHFDVKDGNWEKSHHEDFAHAWEKYCMEGKAPTAALRPVFATLKAWMRQVYENIKNIAGPPLNDDLRSVMDRMLATPEQIQVAHNFMGREAWINPTDNPEYAKKLAKAHEQAESALTFSKNQDMIRQQKKDWQAEYKKNEADVKEEMLSDKSKDLAYKAQMAFKGKDFDGNVLVDGAGNEIEPLRIDKKSLIEKLGPEAAKIVPRGTAIEQGGLDPDIAAQLVGYKDARSMIQDMAKVQPFGKELHDRTVALTDFTKPKLTPDRIAELALDAVHNDASAETLDMELQTLGDKLGVLRKVLPKTADFKAEAQKTVAELKVGDVNSNTYAVAEAKARRESMDAFAKNDMLNTYDALRRERQNHELYRAAMDAKKSVQDGLDYLAKFNKDTIREKIELPFRNQIDALLDQYDLRRWVSKKALASKARLNDFIEGLAADGHVPYIPESIGNAMAQYEALGDKAQRIHYKDMQVQDFQGLRDAVKSLDAMGRNQKEISDGKAKQDLQDVATAFATKTAEIKQRSPETNRGLDTIGRFKQGAKEKIRSAFASMTKMESICDWLDNRDPLGEANTYGFRPLAEAAGKEKDMQDKIAAHLEGAKNTWADATKDKEGKIYEAPAGDGMLDGKLVREGANMDDARQKLDHKQMLMLAGNWGNRSNIDKLCRGEGWREEVVKEFLDKNMTKADWDFVHELSKSFEMVYKEKLEMHRRLGNTDPVRVEPEPFESNGEKYPGWYWPLVYDPARSRAAADRSARKGGDLFENTYRRANTESGRDNTRIEGYAAPLLLSLDAIPKILADEIHDTTHREAIMNADKFFSHPDVEAAISKTLSPEHYEQIRPWLQSIANDTKSDMKALKFFDQAAHGMRTITTMTGLGFRATTMVIHGSSAAGESIAELGNPKWMAQGLQAFANPSNWQKNKQFILENSPEMKLRLSGEVDRDMRDSFKEVNQTLMNPTASAISKGRAFIEARAMQGIAMLDLASAMPTWMGGYLKGLAKESEGGMGLSHEDASYFADKTVRNAHGGGGIKDLAAIQRGPEYVKLTTMFYSFWNHNLNRLMDTGRMAADPETWKDSGKAGQVVMRTMMYVFGVQAIHAMFHKDEQSDHWYSWAAKAIGGAAMGGIPIARNIWNTYAEGHPFQLSPVEEMLSEPKKSMIDAVHAYEGKHVSEDWPKHAVQTAGYIFGIPGAGQASETAQFLWDVHEGRQNPDGIRDWFNGVVSGHAKEK